MLRKEKLSSGNYLASIFSLYSPVFLGNTEVCMVKLHEGRPSERKFGEQTNMISP
jgi:hypothetical protein